jgi:hypothetical protein
VINRLRALSNNIFRKDQLDHDLDEELHARSWEFQAAIQCRASSLASNSGGICSFPPKDSWKTEGFCSNPQVRVVITRSYRSGCFLPKQRDRDQKELQAISMGCRPVLPSNGCNQELCRPSPRTSRESPIIGPLRLAFRPCAGERETLYAPTAIKLPGTNFVAYAE